MFGGMTPLGAAWHDYRDAVVRFSPPARRLLWTEVLMWTGHGVSQVLFNLYFVEAGEAPTDGCSSRSRPRCAAGSGRSR